MSSNDVTQSDHTPVADSLSRLKARAYAELGGAGFLTRLAEEMGEPYNEVVKAFSDATVKRIAKTERILSRKGQEADE